MGENEKRSRTYWLETYGCQMNKAESGVLDFELRRRGWRPAEHVSEAGVVVLNTCSVRKTAEDRIWGRLGFFKAEKRRHPFRLVVMGCMSERLKEEILEQAPHIDLLVGNFQKHRLAEVLDSFQAPEPGAEAPRGRGQSGRIQLVGPGEYRFAQRHAPSGFNAFIPIMHGCNNFCTYCIVPYLRGREVSRSPDGIMEEVRQLCAPAVQPGGGPSPESGGGAVGGAGGEAAGVREITLLGQNVNSYRYTEAGGAEVLFPELLRRITAQLPEHTWLRFLTSHPKDMSGELIELIASEPALCRHIHLPVQHGSDRILAAMGRGYTRAQYLALVRRIRNSIPEVSLTTDILIGFPGETEEDYRITVELMNEVRFDDAFTYRYNPREGTRAYGMPDEPPDAVKQRRLSEVITLQRRITRERKTRRVGAVVKVLVEGISKNDRAELLARTEMNEMVVLPGSPEWIGSFLTARLQGLHGSTFRAEATAEQGR